MIIKTRVFLKHTLKNSFALQASQAIVLQNLALRSIVHWYRITRKQSVLYRFSIV